MEEQKREKTGGREKGTPNKLTMKAKEAITAFINDTSPEVVGLWRDVAAEDPEAAIRLWTNLAEYVIPKHSRVAHVGEEGSEKIQLIVNDSL
jgi:hypothetical protein